MIDSLIIGGGIIGMLTARELVLAGCQVTIIDKSYSGRESSWAGGGIISPLYPWRYTDAVNALAYWGQAYYPDLITEIETATCLQTELLQSGLLMLNVNEWPEAIQWAKKGQIDLQLVNNVEAFELEPNLSTLSACSDASSEPSIWLPNVRQIRNPRFVVALKKYLRQKGVKFIEQRQVQHFIIHHNKVSGVVTDSGKIKAEKLLLAGGAWSADLLDKTGFSIKVEPVKGQMILFKAEPKLLKSIVMSQGRYVIPRQDGRILVGSTLEYTGFDKSTTIEAKNELIKAAVNIIPALKSFPVEHHWAGLRPGSEQGIPYICEHPEVKNLYINTGHFRNGIVLGPASARLMADIMLTRATCFDARLYCCDV